jgi:hypothetical protein
MVGSQRVADDVPEGGGVGLRHVLRAVERSSRLQYGVGRQREHLKEVAITRHQVLLDERMAGYEVVIAGQRQQRTYRIEAGGGQPMALSNQDEQHLEHECMLAETAPEAIA